LEKLFGNCLISPSQKGNYSGLTSEQLLQGMGDSQGQFRGISVSCQENQDYDLSVPGSQPLLSDPKFGNCFPDLRPASRQGGYLVFSYCALAALSGFQSLLSGEQQFSVGVCGISIGQASLQASQSLFKQARSHLSC
jgi:hypothetical protein